MTSANSFFNFRRICATNGSPSKGSKDFGRPMRELLPPARMIAETFRTSSPGQRDDLEREDQLAAITACPNAEFGNHYRGTMISGSRKCKFPYCGRHASAVRRRSYLQSESQLMSRPEPQQIAVAPHVLGIARKDNIRAYTPARTLPHVRHPT